MTSTVTVVEGTAATSCVQVVESSTDTTVTVGLETTPSTVSVDHGTPGSDGESAYQLAVDLGFEGSESEWLASLVGPEGPPGDPAEVTAEINAAVAAEAALRVSGDQAASTALAGETSARTSGDSTNAAAVAAEVTARQNAVTGEASARAAADTTLTNNLAAEVTARTTGDQTNATAISTETTNRQAADTAEAGARAAADALLVPLAALGVTVPTLVSGTIPTSQLPPLVINNTFTVSSQAQMLALAANKGDMAVRSDLNESFILAATPASTLGNWVQVLAAGDVVSVNGQQGAVMLHYGDVGADPAGAAAAAQAASLQIAQNLADLASPGTARTNLGLGSIATHPTSDFVDVTSAQTVAGAKTLTSALTVSTDSSSINIGTGIENSAVITVQGGRGTLGYQTSINAAIIRGGTGKGVGIEVNNSATPALFVDSSGNTVLANGATAGTHTLTLGSSATGIAAYNTADETTNLERAVMAWSGNVFGIGTQNSGTGSARNLQLSAAGGAVTTSVTLSRAALPLVLTSFGGAVAAVGNFYLFSGAALSATAGLQSFLVATPTIQQSGTASYTAILANVTETSTGTGTKSLIDLQVGGASRFTVDNAGNISTPATATSGHVLYNTTDQTTNYERGHLSWGSNLLRLFTEQAGTGAARAIWISVGTSAVFAINPSADSNGCFTFDRNTSSTNGVLVWVGKSTSFSASSTVQTALAVTPTVNQSGTAGYTALLVNPTETATGSGAKLLADFQVAGVSKTRIRNDGQVAYPQRNIAPSVVTGTSTILAGVGKVIVNSSAATSQTLPTTGTDGDELLIKNVNTGVVSLVGTVDGSTTYQLASQYKYVLLSRRGTSWDVIGNN